MTWVTYCVGAVVVTNSCQHSAHSWLRAAATFT